jgi:hypothetical protein
VVKTECTLLSVGRAMDTDIHDFSQVLPGMRSTHCEQEDCVRLVSEGGCFYYVRSLNCYFSEVGTPAPCFERGRTPAGDVFACINPRCAQVDIFAAFPWSPFWPRFADIGLYRVQGLRRTAAASGE